MPQDAGSVSKTRLDALADAMFGVAMTLLVIDIRLPEDFSPKNSAELLQAVLELKPKFLVYLITFFVVGLTPGGTLLAQQSPTPAPLAIPPGPVSHFPTRFDVVDAPTQFDQVLMVIDFPSGAWTPPHAPGGSLVS